MFMLNRLESEGPSSAHTNAAGIFLHDTKPSRKALFALQQKFF